MKHPYFVKATYDKDSKVSGYVVCDNVGGITGYYNEYKISECGSWEVTLELANQERDDRNGAIK